VSSTDLLNWSTVPTTIDVSAIGSVTSTWAPEFVEDTNGDVYIVFSINATNPYWIKATNAALTTWTAPTLLTITGRPTKVIDPVFIKKDSTWYCFYNDDYATQIYRATCATITGTYATDKTGDWAGWGSGLEGPSVVRLHNGHVPHVLGLSKHHN
jgi:beta-xylosidase